MRKRFCSVLMCLVVVSIFLIYGSAFGSDKWTVLIYCSADQSDTLESSLEVELSALQDATKPSSNDVNIVVLVDKFSEQGSSIYEVEDGNITEIETRDEENTADPVVLQNFVSYGLDNYPAERTVLIIKGEGLGWRGICLDRNDGVETDLNLMTVDEIATVLKGQERIDLLVFNGNNMAMIEVAYELREAVPYMVATQSQIQKDGIPYGMFITDLVQTPDMSAAAFAEEIVNDHVEYYSPKGNLGQGPVDTSQNFANMVALDLSKIDLVVKKHTVFAKILGDLIPDLHNIVPHARDLSMVGHFNDIDDYDYLSDISTFATEVVGLLDEKNGNSYSELRNAVDEYLTAFEEAVVAEAHADKFHNVHGLSIWYPPSLRKYNVRDFGSLDDLEFAQTFHYEDADLYLDFITDSSWVNYLMEYYLAVGGHGITRAGSNGYPGPKSS